eukprot:353590-Chlamydomonas_euryale.AAC.20
MHVHDDERGKRGAVELAQVAAHEVDHVGQLRRVGVGACLQRAARRADNRVANGTRPVHRSDHQHDLAGPLEHPLRARRVCIALHAVLRHLLQRLAHACLHLHQPLLHAPVGICRLDLGLERDQLALHALHAGDLAALALKTQLVDALKALFKVRLHARWVLGLRQNLQHLVVGQEEEAGGGGVTANSASGQLLSPPPPKDATQGSQQG